MSKETVVIDKETAKAIKNIGERTLTGHIVTEHDYPEDFRMKTETTRISV